MTAKIEQANAVIEPADWEIIFERLLAAIKETGVPARKIEIVQGSPLLRSGTHPNETMICELEDGSILRLFLKYSRNYRRPDDGHRGGISRETKVYRQLLQCFLDSKIKLIAAGEIRSLGVIFMLLEEIQGHLRISKTPPENMERAAKWIGRFHAANELNLRGAMPAFLSTYDRDYYRQWSRRALELTRPLHPEYPWISEICWLFECNVIPILLETPQTVVHGEFYSKNIMVKGSKIYPVDWESAAIAPGEIDLASLTEGWPLEVIRACSQAYREARWPKGTPKSFQATLEASQFYFLFRWLGNSPYFATGKHGRNRLDALGSLADRSQLTKNKAGSK